MMHYPNIVLPLFGFLTIYAVAEYFVHRTRPIKQLTSTIARTSPLITRLVERFDPSGAPS